MTRYTTDQKLDAIGRVIDGLTRKQVRAECSVSVPTLRVWCRNLDLLAEWESTRHTGGPLPAVFNALMEVAQAAKVPLVSPPMTLDGWGHEIALATASSVSLGNGCTSTLLDPEKVARLLHAFALGAPKWVCWGCIGVQLVNLDEWRKRGEAGEEPFRSLFIAIRQAEAQGVVQKMGVMMDKPREYKAAAWILEHRHPDDFHIRTDQRLEVTDTALPDLPDEELDALLDED